jgi:bleomycin hydrolase
MKRQMVLFLSVAVLLTPLGVSAQSDGFQFDVQHDVTTTSVKDQARTGTCWSFATSSFLETELIRMGKEPVDLSEMFFVRMTYPQKAEQYVRLHGNTTLGQGSLGQDVFRALRQYGAVPEAVYNGRRYGGEAHNHGELFTVLNATLDALINSRQLSPVWSDAVDGILDAYLGDPPETFMYDGKTYTPRSFADELGLDPDNYVELTSFSHHPFYTWFAVEVPDNWARNRSYNLPLDELMAVMDHALENGYSVDWDGDVSERSFCQNRGVAVWPAKSLEERTEEEREAVCTTPEIETVVTQAVRQAGFDDHSSTDDHLMHITGRARDQDGTTYYVTKNSWGLEGPKNGFIYMSESYVRAKTITVIVHKDALPRDVARRID